MKDLASYWRDAFDWRARRVAHQRASRTSSPRSAGTRSTTCISPGPGTGRLPIVLTHGWPGSFLELLEVASRLASGAHGGDPADAFDVVVPSLPGYGFSTSAPGERRASPCGSRSSGPSSCPAWATRASSRREATGAPPSRRGSRSDTPSASRNPSELHSRLVRSVPRPGLAAALGRREDVSSRSAIAGSKRKARTAICRPRGRARRPMP